MSRGLQWIHLHTALQYATTCYLVDMCLPHSLIKTNVCAPSLFAAKEQGPSERWLKKWIKGARVKSSARRPHGSKLIPHHYVLLRHFAYSLLFFPFFWFISILSMLVKNLKHLLKDLKTCLVHGHFAVGTLQPDTVCSLCSGTCGGDVFNNSLPSSMPSVSSERRLLIYLINMFSQRQACCCLYDLLDNCLSLKSLVLRHGRGFAAVSHWRDSLLSWQKNRDTMLWLTLIRKGFMICKCLLQLLLIYERLKNPCFENSQNPGKKKKKAPGSCSHPPHLLLNRSPFSNPGLKFPAVCNTDGTKLSAGTAAFALFHLNLSQTVKLAINLLIPHKEFFLLIWNLCPATLQVVGMRALAQRLLESTTAMTVHLGDF